MPLAASVQKLEISIQIEKGYAFKLYRALTVKVYAKFSLKHVPKLSPGLYRTIIKL